MYKEELKGKKLDEANEKIRQLLHETQVKLQDSDKMQQHLAHLKEQLSRQQKKSAEAKQMQNLLTEKKNHIENICTELQQRLSKKELNSKKLNEANKNLRKRLHETQARLQYAEKMQQQVENICTDLQQRLSDEKLVKSEKLLVCDRFSNFNKNVRVSNCKRYVKGKSGRGFCFINHPDIGNNQILKWTFRVPKSAFGCLGMVNILITIKFDF